MALYKLTAEPCLVILKPSENKSIPVDENNLDYQEYLDWVNEGNTPDPAD